MPLRDGPVVFDDVSFLHGEAMTDLPARGLRGVSLTIAPREFVAVSGPSGAGKTTFADLLVGLLPAAARAASRSAACRCKAQSWPRGASASPISRRIRSCFTTPFAATCSGRTAQASEADIWHALALAGADALVRRMEHGLETVVGERGALVSGGERQRLALARAVLRKPRLLVMDEATSAIDVAGEREILEALRALDPRPTIVIIAHRAESLALCDRVIRIEDGRCIEAHGRAPRIVPLRAVE